MDNSIANRNFRLFLSGQAVSFIGSWMQNVALSWLVLEITGSAFWVGFTTGFPLLTSAALVCLGGILADKFSKKKIIYLTQSVQVIQALTLGFLFFQGQVSLPIILALAFVQGVALAVERPTRVAFINEIIGKCRVKQAISWSATTGQVAKIIGPALAAFLISYIGTGWLFVINGFSFLAIVGTLPMLRIKKNGEILNGSGFELFRSGVEYAFGKQSLRFLIILAGFIAVSGFAYRAILPSIAVDMLHSGPRTLGWLLTFSGIGAGIGSVVVAKKKLSPCLIALGCLMNGITLAIFPLASANYYSGIGILIFAGAGFAISSVTVKVIIQKITKKTLLGRINGLHIAATNGGTALGQFAMGGLASSFGCTSALYVNGFALILLAAFSFYAKRKKQENK